MQLFNALVLIVSILLSIPNIVNGQIQNELGNTPEIPTITSPFFLESFESHTPIDYPGSQPFNLSGDNNATISDINVLDGSRSMLSHIPLSPLVDDPRSELRHKGGTGSPSIVGWQHRPFTTRTFLFSYYFPEDMVFDPVEETIMQWKNQADEGCDVGTPPFSIRISDDNIKYNIKYDPAACTTTPTTVYGNINKALTRGVWHHFVVEIHYDYRVSNTNGQVKIWYSEDDPVTVADSVLNYSGPVGYNDKLWPYLKVGIYKSEWKSKRNRQMSTNAGVTERKMWIDQVGIIEGPWKFNPVENKPIVPKDSIRYSMNKPFVWPIATAIEGETIKMTVTSTGTTKLAYQWFKNGTEIIGATSSFLELKEVALSDAGNYQVETSDSYNSVLSEEAKIIVKEKINCSTLQLSANLTNESCNGNDGAISLQVTGGTAPYTYAWSRNGLSARASLSNLSAGSYEAQVTDVNGCVVTKTFTINTIPGPTKPVISEVEGFLSVNKVQDAKYQWHLNGSMVQESNEEKLRVSQSGEYSATVIDANGCAAVSDIFYIEALTNAFNHSLIQDIKVYPVPATTEITIDLKLDVATATTSYQVFSLAGNLEMEENLGETARSSSISIDVNDLTPGVHLLKVKVLNEIIVRRFMKN